MYIKIKHEVMKSYATVAGSKSINSRLAIGSNADLELYEDGWLIKKDKPGFDLVGNEFKCLLELQESGLVPEVDESSFDGWSFVIKEVAYGATLDEYCRVCPDNVLLEIMASVGKMLNQFWSLGFVHRDLHANNILIGYSQGQWRSYLIDFGHSYNTNWSEEDLELYCNNRGDILQELPIWEDDFTTLQDALDFINPDLIASLEKELTV